MGHSNPFRSKSALHNLIVRGIADQLKPPIDRIVVLLAPSGGLGFSYTTMDADSLLALIERLHPTRNGENQILIAVTQVFPRRIVEPEGTE